MKSISKSLLGVMCLLAASIMMAADGATEIWEPTTITEPGRYVVTRNITTAGTVISIQSDDVMLDLNGFTVEDTDASSAAIEVLPASNVTIENGHIRAANDGIVTPSDPSIPLVAMVVRNTSVTAGSTGISVEAIAEMILIEGNRFDCNHGIYGVLFENSAFEGNIIECGSEGSVGISSITGMGNVIRDNIIRGCKSKGIWLYNSQGNTIRGNTISGSDGTDGAALYIESPYNQIEGNFLVSNYNGLVLAPGSPGANFNVYRGNSAKASHNAGLIDLGSFNLSHGDNYMPTQM